VHAVGQAVRVADVQIQHLGEHPISAQKRIAPPALLLHPSQSPRPAEISRQGSLTNGMISCERYLAVVSAQPASARSGTSRPRDHPAMLNYRLLAHRRRNMSYLDNNIASGERPFLKGPTNWFVFVSSTVFPLSGIAISAAQTTMPPYGADSS
jgi:hypothetical protein